MSFTGSCHCGKIKLTVEGDPPSGAMECNCSICRRKGYLHHFTEASNVTIEADDADVATYVFNKHRIRHRFCKTCGCAPYCDGAGADGKEMIAVNLRCADGIDLSKLNIKQVDGASL